MKTVQRLLFAALIPMVLGALTKVPFVELLRSLRGVIG
jgi:hypothetical protein